MGKTSTTFENFNLPFLTKNELRKISDAAEAKFKATPKISKASNESKKYKEPKESKEDRISQIISCVSKKILLFNDGNSGFATTREVPQKTYALDSASFGEWLASTVHRDFPPYLKTYEKREVLNFLKAKAKYDSPERPIFVRSAQVDGEIFLDLCDSGWRQVKVTASGWRVIDGADSPARFQRFPGMAALPSPEEGGSIEQLKKIFNVSEDHFFLCVSWLVQVLHGGKSFPILILNGPQGTGKTTASRVLRSLTDPSDVPDSGPPRNERDAIIAASRSYVLAWDNLSRLDCNFSDWICRFATGAGIRTRKLYKDAEENTVWVSRPIIMNAISALLARDDLADRAITIKLLPIENNRKTEEEYWSSFEVAKPKIFGALLNLLVGVIRDLPTTEVKATPKPRMLSFARLGVAVEKVCGWKQGSFLKAYKAARIDSAQTVLEGSNFAQTLIRLADRTDSGTVFQASKLRNRLNNIARQEGLNTYEKAFKNFRDLKDAVERLNPALSRCYGFEFRWRKGKNFNEYVFSRENSRV